MEKGRLLLSQAKQGVERQDFQTSFLKSHEKKELLFWVDGALLMRLFLTSHLWKPLILTCKKMTMEVRELHHILMDLKSWLIVTNQGKGNQKFDAVSPQAWKDQNFAALAKDSSKSLEQ